MSTCKARRHNDEMRCDHCNRVWELNDPDPPKCNPQRIEHHAERDMRRRLRTQTKTDNFKRLWPAEYAELQRGESGSKFYRSLIKQISETGTLSVAQLNTVMQNVTTRRN